MPYIAQRILEATSNWLLNVPFNAQVYLPKENWLVYVATTYTPLREDWGRIGLRIENQIQQWDVHPDGTGRDGSQCILPVERTIRNEAVQDRFEIQDALFEQVMAAQWNGIAEVAHRVNQRVDGLIDQMESATQRVQFLGQALEPLANNNYIQQGRAADEVALGHLYQVDYASLEARLVSEVLAMNDEVSRQQELIQPNPPTRFERIEKDE